MNIVQFPKNDYTSLDVLKDFTKMVESGEIKAKDVVILAIDDDWNQYRATSKMLRSDLIAVLQCQITMATMALLGSEMETDL